MEVGGCGLDDERKDTGNLDFIYNYSEVDLPFQEVEGIVEGHLGPRECWATQHVEAQYRSRLPRWNGSLYTTNGLVVLQEPRS